VYEGSTNLDAGATNWPSPPALLYGTNVLYVDYALYNSPNIILSTPVESDLTPVADWNPEVDLFSVAYESFVVGAPAPVPFLLIASRPPASGGNFLLSFQTLAGQSETIQFRTNLTFGQWLDVTNFIGDGSVQQFSFPTTNSRAKFFRVITQ
jgi:hypothetical protein